MEETTFARPAMIPGIAGSVTLFLANMAAPGREISWTIVRVIVCAAAIWVVVGVGRAGRGWFSFVFAVAAIIYNPIAIVTGTRDYWGWADFVMIALFVWALASIVLEKPPSVEEVTFSSQSKPASRALSHGPQAIADGPTMDRSMTTENVQRDEEASALGALERDGRAALELDTRYLDYERDDPLEEEFFIDEAFMIPAEAFRVDDGVETTWPGFLLCAPDQIAFLQPEDLDAKRTDSQSPTVVRHDEFETCIFRLPEGLPDMSTLAPAAVRRAWFSRDRWRA